MQWPGLQGKHGIRERGTIYQLTRYLFTALLPKEALKKILEVKTVLVFPLSFSSVCLSIFCQNISHWLPGACTRLALGAVYNTILGKLVIYCNGRKSKSKGNSISKILLFYMFRVTSVTLPVAVGQQISRHHPSERTLGPSRGNIGWSPDMGPRCPTSLNRLSTRI